MSTNPSLFRVWSFDSNDRREIARIKAYDFETVQDFLLSTFIKEDFRSQVNKEEFGLSWDACTPKECLENVDQCDKCSFRNKEDILDPSCDNPQLTLEQQKINNKDNNCRQFTLDPDYNPCEFCDGCLTGFEIEEIENPDGKSFGETFEFKTIFGTNDFYDLTGKEPQKAEDWHPLLSSAWKKSDKLGAEILHHMTKHCCQCGKMAIVNIEGYCSECKP